MSPGGEKIIETYLPKALSGSALEAINNLSTMEFIPGEKKQISSLRLGKFGNRFIDDWKVSTFLEEMDIRFGQTSYGTTSVGLEITDPKITSVRMLCQDNSGEDGFRVGWSGNLLDDKQGETGKVPLTMDDIGMEAANKKTNVNRNHPLTVVRIVRDGRQHDVIIKTKFTGTADNWNVDYQIQDGMFATRVDDLA